MAGSDLYTGSLELLILKSVSFGPQHGYAIGRWIRDTTDAALAIEEGALYPALHRMARKGFLDEAWGVTDTGREAKFYKLSPAGRARLKAETLRWRQYARLMNAALDAARP